MKKNWIFKIQAFFFNKGLFVYWKWIFAQIKVDEVENLDLKF